MSNEQMLKLAESIVSQVDKRTIAEIAQTKLNEVMESYEVKSAIERELKEPVKKEVKKIIPTKEFKAKIHKETLKRIDSILGSVVDEVLRNTVLAMTKKR